MIFEYHTSIGPTRISDSSVYKYMSLNGWKKFQPHTFVNDCIWKNPSYMYVDLKHYNSQYHLIKLISKLSKTLKISTDDIVLGIKSIHTKVNTEHKF